MKFIIIVGPQAVGKMTVGHELEKVTDLKLFHNHLTIELVHPFFDYGTEAGNRLVKLFRREMFEEFAKSDLYGVIFTFVWRFDMQVDWKYVEETSAIFESRGNEVYIVELQADMEERLERNKSPHRLEHKATKRNIEWSEAHMKDVADKFRLNSVEGEVKKENYIKINNTNLSAEETAKVIQERFGL
ncbi:AAA family ATPase [Paenisporosarcina indica]|uniref:AAA family ATPase n=1 Tax=Paenisporosarcina indica TaxID=650093 RepID=UPI00094FE27B|nr:AAA family ATPase [Paenisporosarcina indica]